METNEYEDSKNIINDHRIYYEVPATEKLWIRKQELKMQQLSIFRGYTE